MVAGLAVLAAALSGGGEDAFGKQVQVTDIAGKSWTIPAQEQVATVLLFLATECPVANSYAPELERIAGKYGEMKIAFVRVYSDGFDGQADVAAHTEKYHYTMAGIVDAGQELMRRCGATVTPEAVVVLRDGTIAYRGRIDDRYFGLGKYKRQAERHDLCDALDAVAAGKLPEVAETKAIGCSLAPVKAEGEPKANGAPSTPTADTPPCPAQKRQQ